MGKKNKKKHINPKSDSDNKDLNRSKKILVSGIGILIAGFIILSFVDRTAENFAGFAAPLILIAGWIVIGVGLWGIESEE